MIGPAAKLSAKGNKSAKENLRERCCRLDDCLQKCAIGETQPHEYCLPLPNVSRPSFAPGFAPRAQKTLGY